jgi:predicted GIY-YIG superfamily endonuclease
MKHCRTYTAVIARLDRATSIAESRPMGARSFYVYILASRIGGTLYIGVTNDLIRRIAEHRLKSVKGFTKKYEVDKLFRTIR